MWTWRCLSACQSQFKDIREHAGLPVQEGRPMDAIDVATSSTLVLVGSREQSRRRSGRALREMRHHLGGETSEALPAPGATA